MPFGRKRGAQPGNRNAITHGIYAGLFGPKADKILRRARSMDPQDLADEIALLRTSLRQLATPVVDKDGKPVVDADGEPVVSTNLELLVTLMRTLVRAVAVHHGLNKHQEDGIHESMVDLMRTLIPAAGGL